MVPQMNQGRGYASKQATASYISFAMGQGMKPVAGQVMGQPRGQDSRQITTSLLHGQPSVA